MNNQMFIRKPDAATMRGAFEQAIGLLRDCVAHWDYDAIAEYKLDRSFDEFVDTLEDSVQFREVTP
jgi:hypothetical protein